MPVKVSQIINNDKFKENKIHLNKNKSHKNHFNIIYKRLSLYLFLY